MPRRRLDTPDPAHPEGTTPSAGAETGAIPQPEGEGMGSQSSDAPRVQFPPVDPIDTPKRPPEEKAAPAGAAKRERAGKRAPYDNSARLESAERFGPEIDAGLSQLSLFITGLAIRAAIEEMQPPPHVASAVGRVEVEPIACNPFPVDLVGGKVQRLTPGGAIAYFGHDLGLSSASSVVDWFHEHPTLFSTLGLAASLGVWSHAAIKAASVTQDRVRRVVSDAMAEENARRAESERESPTRVAPITVETDQG